MKRSMRKSKLCFVLHAHLPFVPCRHRQALEERWLFEAITESYVPLISIMEGWRRDGVDWRLTLSVSPTLSAMLRNQATQARYLRHLNQLIRLAQAEQVRHNDQPEFQSLAVFYEQKFEAIRATWMQYGGDLTRALAAFARDGRLELITTTATHAFLPYVLTEEAVRVQLALAVQSHLDTFGLHPAGIWLPECAYRPGVDKHLGEFGMPYSFMDTHGLRNAQSQPLQDVWAPVQTEQGIVFFARDSETAQQVWDAHNGYPGAPDYREFYRDIGHDLPDEEIDPFLTDGIRTDTGMKYYRVTGQGKEKAIYHPEVARHQAALHANDFLQKLQSRVDTLPEACNANPVLTCMYDAELFGHWWYEGPEFLNQLVRGIHIGSVEIQLSTPGTEVQQRIDPVTRMSTVQQVELDMSSWGRAGYGEVWLNERNDGMYRRLHRMEREMIALATDVPTPHDIERRILNQAARELLLAQSSDWAFMKDNQTAVQYAEGRFEGHVRAFNALTEMIRQRHWNLRTVATLEHSNNLFPHIDYSLYRTGTRTRSRIFSASHFDVSNVTPCSTGYGADRKRCVLMLSWEYPPEEVGGLARHVHQLAVALVGGGCEVHVLTRQTAGTPDYEVSEGVHLHRAVVKEPHGSSFLDWVFQLNISMVQRCQQPDLRTLEFDVLHAHDWLVARASLALQSLADLPLLTTIHATEHGRNEGIRTELQRKIHAQEAALIAGSNGVIVCSRFMKREVARVHDVGSVQVDVIPNGVTLEELPRVDRQSRGANAKTVLFVGRMVREKGVDVLLEAAQQVLRTHPETKFVLAGTGPMVEEWRRWGEQIGPQVEFAGFVANDVRDDWLRRADVCVFPSLYEPFGIVTLEATAAGTPVVVSATGGLLEVVTHDVTGCLFEPGNALALAHQITRVLTDVPFAQSLVRNARQSAREHYAWSTIAGRTSETYARIGNQARHKEVGIQ